MGPKDFCLFYTSLKGMILCGRLQCSEGYDSVWGYGVATYWYLGSCGGLGKLGCLSFCVTCKFSSFICIKKLVSDINKSSFYNKKKKKKTG